MENITQLVLSHYQRAILNEMGVSSWKLVDVEQTHVKVKNQSYAATTSSEVTSKADALVKLKQFKTQTTDSVLLTFPQTDTKSQIFSDVLISLGLETKQQKYIPTEQLAQYSNYPLSWTQGEKVSLSHKQLITPALSELNHSDTKKQLWQQLQNALCLTKT
jgi:DNA polymerase III psi subunit